MAVTSLERRSTIFKAECPSCGNILGDKEEPYIRLLVEGYSPGEAMDELGIIDFCCRSRVLCPVVIPKGHLRDQFAKDIYKGINSKPKIVAQKVPVLIVLQRRNGKEYISTVKIPSHLCNIEESINLAKLEIVSPETKKTISSVKEIDSKYTTSSFVEPLRREFSDLPKP